MEEVIVCVIARKRNAILYREREYLWIPLMITTPRDPRRKLRVPGNAQIPGTVQGVTKGGRGEWSQPPFALDTEGESENSEARGNTAVEPSRKGDVGTTAGKR